MADKIKHILKNISDIHISKINIYLGILSLIGILYRSYPHLFLIPRWIIEEETFSYTVFELIKNGYTVRLGYQPILEQYIVYYIYLFTHVNPILLVQYINPIMGGLIVIPIYYCLKQISTQKEALIASTLWIFNENMIYRSSTFNSTESFGLFLSMFALFFYMKKNYLLFSSFIIISTFTHLLPAIFMVGVVALDVFLKGNIKSKTIAVMFICLVIIFLYSPLNPHSVMLYSITPNIFLSQFNLSNIFLYSISDLFFGASIFFGSIVLIFFSIPTILKYNQKNQIIYVYLFGCLSLFVISWLAYSNYMLGPTRIVMYFVFPLAYFSSIFIAKFKNKTSMFFVFTMVIIMVLTSLNGVNTMLYIDKSLTSDEYDFLDLVSKKQMVDYYDDWWCDFPLRTNILMLNKNLKPSTTPNIPMIIHETGILANMNSTLSTTRAITHINGTVTIITKPPIFKYVILTPRMERSAFFLVNTKYRTIQISQPIIDIWKDLPDWKLIEEYKNIKLYKWIGIDIEG